MPIHASAAPLLIQLPATVPGKATEDVLSAGSTASNVGDPDGALSYWLCLGLVLVVVAIW